jgi:hypothetical protein
VNVLTIASFDPHSCIVKQLRYIKMTFISWNQFLTVLCVHQWLFLTFLSFLFLFSSGLVCFWWGDYLKKEKCRSNRDSPEQASLCGVGWKF